MREVSNLAMDAANPASCFRTSHSFIKASPIPKKGGELSLCAGECTQVASLAESRTLRLVLAKKELEGEDEQVRHEATEHCRGSSSLKVHGLLPTMIKYTTPEAFESPCVCCGGCSWECHSSIAVSLETCDCTSYTVQQAGLSSLRFHSDTGGHGLVLLGDCYDRNCDSNE